MELLEEYGAAVIKQGVDRPWSMPWPWKVCICILFLLLVFFIYAGVKGWLVSWIVNGVVSFDGKDAIVEIVNFSIILFLLVAFVIMGILGISPDDRLPSNEDIETCYFGNGFYLIEIDSQTDLVALNRQFDVAKRYSEFLPQNQKIVIQNRNTVSKKNIYSAMIENNINGIFVIAYGSISNQRYFEFYEETEYRGKQLTQYASNICIVYEILEEGAQPYIVTCSRNASIKSVDIYVPKNTLYQEININLNQHE